MRTPPALDRTAWTASGRLRVAFSGGADSVCLLKRLLEDGQAARVDALHVDHRLDPDSPSRAERAAALAEQLGVPFECIVLDPDRFEHHRGPEAAARHARYAALSERLAPDDTLLTAHHLDDQIETLLLQLLRGAGPRGLAGMPVRRRLGPGWLGRPLLDWTRAALQDELLRAGLDWIEDPTNASTDPDRNFLRHEVLPIFEQRWGSGYKRSIDRARKAQAQAIEILDERARRDLGRLRQAPVMGAASTLELDGWLSLPAASAFDVLRLWLAPDPAPPATRFEEFRRQCEHASSDRVPSISTGQVVIHAWRGRLWRSASPEPVPPAWSRTIDGSETSFELPFGLGRLEVDSWPQASIQVGAIHDGDRMRTSVRRHRQRVKELLRDAGVPPWLRHRLPALRIDDRLAAIGDRWIAPEWVAHELHWRGVPADLLPYASELNSTMPSTSR